VRDDRRAAYSIGGMGSCHGLVVQIGLVGSVLYLVAVQSVLRVGFCQSLGDGDEEDMHLSVDELCVYNMDVSCIG
jgi:hypothetical protein